MSSLDPTNTTSDGTNTTSANAPTPTPPSPAAPAAKGGRTLPFTIGARPKKKQRGNYVKVQQRQQGVAIRTPVANQKVLVFWANRASTDGSEPVTGIAIFPFAPFMDLNITDPIYDSGVTPRKRLFMAACNFVNKVVTFRTNGEVWTNVSDRGSYPFKGVVVTFDFDNEQQIRDYVNNTFCGYIPTLSSKMKQQNLPKMREGLDLVTVDTWDQCIIDETEHNNNYRDPIPNIVMSEVVTLKAWLEVHPDHLYNMCSVGKVPFSFINQLKLKTTALDPVDAKLYLTHKQAEATENTASEQTCRNLLTKIKQEKPDGETSDKQTKTATL